MPGRGETVTGRLVERFGETGRLAPPGPTITCGGRWEPVGVLGRLEGETAGRFPMVGGLGLVTIVGRLGVVGRGSIPPGEDGPGIRGALPGRGVVRGRDSITVGRVLAVVVGRPGVALVGRFSAGGVVGD